MATIHDDIARAPHADRRVWAGRALSGLAILFLAMDAGAKLAVPQLMIAHSPPLGLPADPGFYRLLGAILALCTVLYAWPRTAFLGALLLTGYLGGAVASHLRVGSPLIGYTLFGIYLGAMVWGGAVAARSARPRAVAGRGLSTARRLGRTIMRKYLPWLSGASGFVFTSVAIVMHHVMAAAMLLA